MRKAKQPTDEFVGQIIDISDTCQLRAGFLKSYKDDRTLVDFRFWHKKVGMAEFRPSFKGLTTTLEDAVKLSKVLPEFLAPFVQGQEPDKEPTAK